MAQVGVAERREREREERRQAILDAAERVFFDRGPVNATMEEVAQAAELSKGTLYLYFESKDALYMGIATRALEVLVGRVESMPDADTGLGTLQRFMALHREFVLQYPDRFRAVLAWSASGFRAEREAPTFSAYQALSHRMFRRVVGCIQAGQRDGSIRADLNAVSTTVYLWGAASGVWTMYFNRDELTDRLPERVDFDQVLTGLSDMVLRSVRAEGASATAPCDCGAPRIRGEHG